MTQQCSAETRSGARCRRLSVEGEDRCGQHATRRFRVIDGGGAVERLSVTAAAGGSRVELLRALRDKIACDIDEGVPARDLASLSKRLLDISKELEGLESQEDPVSDAAGTPDEAWPAS